MRNLIDIDHTHSRAISEEIGERLQAYLSEEPELPASLRKQVERLRELEGPPPSIVPTVERRFGNVPHRDARREDRWRFIWSWRRKS
jgi:hypothetical protein